MKKKRIIILGILVLGLILTVSLVSINSFQKQKSEDSPTETTNDIFQSEEQADTDVEFSNSEPDNQQNKEDTGQSEDSKDSSDAQRNSTSTKQESSKDSEEVKKIDETKDSEQEKDPEPGDNSGNSGKDELWTGFY